MAVLILVSATGFSVHAHTCAGELHDFAFYGKAEKCLMDVPVKPSCHSAAHDETIKTEPCCKNHAYQLEQHEESVEISALKIFQPEMKLVALACSFVLPLLQGKTTDEIVHEVYQYPPLARDIPVLVQSFLL